MPTVSTEAVISCIIFSFEKPQIQETTMAQVSYDKLLSNQAHPSHTEEYGKFLNKKEPIKNKGKCLLR